MLMARSRSFIDTLISNTDQMLQTLSPKAAQPERRSPAQSEPESQLSEKEKKHIAGLMRINHAGEVCAQGLYQGQALTASKDDVRQAMEHSAKEEVDHLAWCEERIHQMGSHTSVLNPLWYAMSFGLGAVAGAIGDKVSLGFVAATEDQVCEHLNSHLKTLPENDSKSRAIIQQMLIDEADHASKALENGGIKFPKPVKKAMTLVSHVMTKTTYRV
jgi:ubiquinone biosynthesis monooxygenase Coq7